MGPPGGREFTIYNLQLIVYSLLIGGAWGSACWVRLPFLFLIAVSLCTGRRSNEDNIVILLLIGLHLGRFPARV